MVDFQKRDTRRGLEEKPDEPETDEDPETEAPSVPDAAELAARAAAEQADETGDDPDPGSTDANAGADAETDGDAGDDDHAGHDEGPTRDAHDHGNPGHGEHDNGNPGHGEHDHGDHEHAHHDHADGGHHAHDLDSLGVAVVTVSSTRSLADDPAGDAIVGTLDADGHEVVTRELIGDDLDGIQRSVNALAARGDVDVVVTTGGTGVTPDDVTPEAVEPLFDKELPGFGELFRELSREEIGSRVVVTRAVGGVVEGVPVFCLPGSEAAATLGIEAIVLPEAPHLAGLARRDEGDADGH